MDERGGALPKPGYILSIDQGTTGTTAILVDGSGRALWRSSREIAQIYPQPGWVEHDPVELFESCIEVVDDLLEETEISPRQIEAVGISNQRETTVVWERDSGRPAANAVVWQCRRTAALCEAMKSRGLEPDIRERTGLPIDAYFSGTKLRWVLDNIPEGQRKAESGELLFGTVDSWLLWNLTNGLTHATDVTNASRTMLFNTGTLAWDQKLLAELDLPAAVLPEVKRSSEVFAHTGGNLFGGQSIPIGGIAGDQHAALFGHACFQPGQAKNTYGTGSFVLMNTGQDRVTSDRGLITTPAWGLPDAVTYALEGSIFSTGATVQWLRDGLQIIEEASETEHLAESVQDNGGVYLVPAFTGLGAPHWDMYARGTLVGLTRGTTRAHIARAALEATAYQTRDVIDAMSVDAGIDVPILSVDGGGTDNDFLMQFQSDILGIPIQRGVAETTAMGAAYLAGLAVGFWDSLHEIEEIAGLEATDRTFEPSMSEDERESLYEKWKAAVERASGWAAG